MKSITRMSLVLLLVAELYLLGLAQSGTIITVAGTGTPGSSGDGGPAIAAQLRSPSGVAVDTAGNLFIADSGSNRVRMITPSGIISTVAGNGSPTFGGDGGPATSAQLHGPLGVAVDAAGNLFIADGGDNHVRMVTPGGIISTVAGTGIRGFSGDGGPATSAQISNPFAVAVDAAGNLFITDRMNGRIRKVTPQGIISTVVGNGIQGFGGDYGPAIGTQLAAPRGITFDRAGNLFIADYGSQRVRKVTPNGIISTVAGNGIQGFSGDGGPATSAQLNHPSGIAMDALGNLFISEDNNHRIRKVTTGGIISTVAGNGTTGFSGDGGLATSAQLYQPTAVAVDAAGNLFIADRFNSRIRKVTLGVVIIKLTGNRDR